MAAFRCTITTPPIALRQRGAEGSSALGLTPRLNQPATKAMLASRAKASPFCGPRQIFALLPPKRPDREGVLRGELAHASPSSRPPDADLARALAAGGGPRDGTAVVVESHGPRTGAQRAPAPCSAS